MAAAVSASFNAPIAGALFALEVVLRHFAVHAFAPIVIASVAGTVVSRLHFGDVAEYALPGATALNFYQELPAFLILGLLSGLVAVVFMRTIFWTEGVAGRLMRRTGLPRYLQARLGPGSCLGLLAIWFPHIIGVGYETVSAALTGELTLQAGDPLCRGQDRRRCDHPGWAHGRWRVLTRADDRRAHGAGLSGYIATGIFPDVSGSETLYALAGMGAVAAAVLGAPISTTLIIFELTGDWQTGLAVMVAVSLSTALCVQPGGPVVLSDPAGTAQHPPGGRAAGLSPWRCSASAG